jgi:hypothetical protein
MTIFQDDLRRAAARRVKTYAAVSGQKTAFLCHSHRDRVLAEGLQALLHESGLNLYIDWQDASMPEQPSRETASRLRQRIRDADLFLYLATQNAANSKWCPWELGYADGKKSDRTILVVPTRDAAGGEHGNEYVQLYRHFDHKPGAALQFYEAGSYTGRSMQAIW